MAAHRIFAPAVRVQPPEITELGLRKAVTGTIYGGTKPSRTRISQRRDVYFEGIGLVTVSAHEDIGETPKLVLTSASSGAKLFEAYVQSDLVSQGDDLPGLNPTLRFTVQTLKGFHSPVVIAVAMEPGGSDDGWESFAVGLVDGSFAQVTFDHLRTNDDGGFFFGDLGNGIGVGAAQWNFVWGEDESHPPPHRYEIKLYKWNGRRFEWDRVLRTRVQLNCARDAVRALGFHFSDMRASFSEWAFLGDWREMCNRN